MEIIPAIDIIDGKCVRLTHGDFSAKKIYNEYPLEVALEFEDAGLNRLHLVDLDGARYGSVKNWKVLETIAGKTKLKIDFGGGIKSEKDVKVVFDSGACMATVGSIAVKEPDTFKKWIKLFSPRKFLLGADVKDEKITISGWTEQTEISVYDFIKEFSEEGIEQIFCTDVMKDGTMEGISEELYKKIILRFPGIYFIASGGVSSMDDLHQLNEMGCSGVIIGKAIYEGRILLKDIKRIL